MRAPGWSPAEKRAARAAFEAAWARECTALKHEAEAMLSRSADPAAIWDVGDYLAKKRREIDQKYDYRYSVLTRVLGRLLAEEWLNDDEIAALAPDKIAEIKRIAEAWS